MFLLFFGDGKSFETCFAEWDFSLIFCEMHMDGLKWNEPIGCENLWERFPFSAILHDWFFLPELMMFCIWCQNCHVTCRRSEPINVTIFEFELCVFQKLFSLFQFLKTGPVFYSMTSKGENVSVDLRRPPNGPVTAVFFKNFSRSSGVKRLAGFLAGHFAMV